MVEMTREYDVLKNIYNDLVANRERADMSVNLERGRSASSSTCSIRRGCPSARSARTGR